VAAKLLRRGALVRYADPHVPSLTIHEGEPVPPIELTASELAANDLVVITTRHDAVDWGLYASTPRWCSTLEECALQGRSGWHTL